MASLIAEIELWSSREPELVGFDTIYFGGGTPSMLTAEQLERVVGALRRNLDVAPDARIFFEANPEDVTRENLGAWRDLGVSALSLGVQSFDDDALGFLGRLHDARQARVATEQALGAGFDTVSVDLIYGLPDQTKASWREQLAMAIDLAPEHLSCYQLTVHRETVFGVQTRRGQLTEMPDEAQADLFLLTHRRLAEGGYEGYEVSNFARSSAFRSRHNMKYWDHTPYLGLGPSAHSYAGRRRWWNHRKLSTWEASVIEGTRPIDGSESLGDRELLLERLMLGLRTRDGVDLTALSGARSSQAVASETLQRLPPGQLEFDGARLVPTLEGLAVADSLAHAAYDALTEPVSKPG